MKYKIKEKRINKNNDKTTNHERSLFLDLRELQSTMTTEEFNEFLLILKADAKQAGITVDDHIFDKDERK